MDSNNFIKLYESALASQDWHVVESLISDDACVTFSNGAVHKGKLEVQIAFENNFKKIKGENYIMENITWLKTESEYAIYLFEYSWSGYIDEKLISGSGVGTSVIIYENERWMLLSEHLGIKK